MRQNVLEKCRAASRFFNETGEILEIDSGLIIGKNIISQVAINELAEACLLDYTTRLDGRNNVTNIGIKYYTINNNLQIRRTYSVL